MRVSITASVSDHTGGIHLLSQISATNPQVAKAQKDIAQHRPLFLSARLSRPMTRRSGEV
ncbi:hypothetical protein [Streptomyces parvulus]|uniref:hypothetical protein n=1 Tax=Streptomyces parvulus TaxID=146923 RepID=UPI0033D47DF1